MRIHVIGVAGTGMGSLAGLLVELGHDVTGSDVNFDPPIGPALAGWGVSCLQGFEASNLDSNPDLVVVGNVCRKDNPEVLAAKARGHELAHIGDVLQRFVLDNTSPLVISGTHGKTTTSALAAFLLDQTGFRPGFLIGGMLPNFERSFRAPTRALPVAASRLWQPERATPERRQSAFVIEGDEYDTAFFEKTPKFWHYRAELAIVTSIEHDHVDIYESPEGYERAFAEFIRRVPAHGLIAANAADSTVVRIVQESARARVLWYALSEQRTGDITPEWTAALAHTTRAGTAFDLFVGGSACGRFVCPLFGDHNLSNVLAALAVTNSGYGLDLERARHALPRFGGVKRRQELIGTPGGVFVYDDFAHHPTAVGATLGALRRRHGDARLFAIFEPRTATACRRLHQKEYALCFDAADRVLLAPLGRSGLPHDDCLNLEQLCQALRARGVNADRFESVEQIVERLKAELESGDVVVTLSNGSFGQIQEKLVARLATVD